MGIIFQVKDFILKTYHILVIVNLQKKKLLKLKRSLISCGSKYQYFSKSNLISGEIIKKDILVIAPYNAQVNLLKYLNDKAKISTVDKFQGQEAPISIFSLTTVVDMMLKRIRFFTTTK